MTSTACARTVVDEWARAGLTDAVVAPGSRSAPLALALADDARIRLHVHLDERSAAFFALGLGKASGRPALALCTSGTAAAHFHPAVLEAHHSRVPLLVCTADRPAELRATGAPQATDQVRLYGPAVRFFADVPADGDPGARAAWRPIAARAWAEAAGPPAGPVHLNVAFREPLVPVPGAAAEPGRAGARPWTASHRSAPALAAAEERALIQRLRTAPRGLLVAGWGSPPAAGAVAAALGWPLLADAISGHRSPGGFDAGRPAGPSAFPGAGGEVAGAPAVITTYEALLRAPGFAEAHRPDLVLRCGGPLTSKIATAWLDAAVPQILVDPDGAWLDPNRTADERVPALPDPARLAEAGDPSRGPSPGGEWRDGWLHAEAIARGALEAFLDGDDRPSEGRVARDVAAACAASASQPALFVASSMPVRDLEAFAGRVPSRVYANRGVNGIDGLVSTVLGIAAGGGRPVVGLLGDLGFLHDAGGLLGARRREVDAVFVVVDNDGGGIFSFLPQAALSSDRFELLFGTPPDADPAEVAGAYGLPARRVERSADVGPAVEEAVSAGGVQVVVVPTGDRTANVDRHRQAWAAVAEALAKSAT
ncbi:MAG TPA: 2-succinyl-5-enolpyruvyl-6-hydroxy-3-cyclohexene-1-carboxylic-acid synthase [Acidimicrobiia bacterium]|nr:2-succinyl-5-enolpyruvyl-6-hydroxy-3-cyclohexene-1-carboxylic-acid synthase [Acidimicrobiia bacterium]HZQ76347.1 2-succinyl-5-enolpyruvyl-6-hydroxy-3-cyclohexene-1-carboxylic-acid synthase [Acidimicrobiia bacterium]